MKKKTFCILCGMVVAIIFALPTRADTIPYISTTPSPTPTITTSRPLRTAPTPIPSGPPISSPSSAPTTMPSMTCDGVPNITINIAGLPDTITSQAKIQEYFTDYTHYLYDGVYKLCFDIQNGPAMFKTPFIIRSLDKPLVVSGFKAARSNDSGVPRDFDIVTIEGISNPVIFIDSDIQCSGAADEAAGLVLRGSGHTVKHSIFRGCAEGIRIDGSNMNIGADIDIDAVFDQAKFDSERNEIYNNAVGINWTGGPANINNNFSYNLIHHNGTDSANYLPNDAIIISVDPSISIPRPEFVFRDAQAEAENKALHCVKDSSGRIISRFLKFDPSIALSGLEMLIYEADPSNQIFRFVSKCISDDQGRCPITTLQPAYSFLESENECGVAPSIRIVALTNALSHTSMLASKAVLLNGPPTLIGAGGTSVDLPSVPEGEVDVEDTADDTGNNATGDGSGSGEDLEVQMAPAMGMKTGCGGMIVPGHTQLYNRGEFFILWWLIFMAPAVLVAVRIKKRK